MPRRHEGTPPEPGPELEDVLVVVVGAIVADNIEHADGRITRSLGGTAHTVAALSALAGARHTIVPVSRVGADCRARVEAWAARLSGVSLAAIDWIAADHPRVRLSYREAARPGERVERLSGTLPPLQPADVEVAGDADVTLVNCVTGDDCTWQALDAVRRACARVYLDVHSLALGTAADGRRFLRPRADWDLWLGNADVVQCNHAEAATVLGLAPDGAGEEEVVAALVDKMHGRRAGGPTGLAGPISIPPVWLLTRGSAGAVLLHRSAGGIRTDRIAAPRVTAVDPTGAGDAFGAGYVSAWLSGATPRAATERAVHAGAAACTLPGAPDPDAFEAALSRLATP